MKILVDMNLTPAWVQFFAQREIESVHWSTVGDPKAEDPVIMEFARADQAPQERVTQTTS